MIDAHIHLDDKKFDGNRAKLIADAQAAGISQFIVPAVLASGFDKLKNLTTQHKSITPSYGLHPYFVNQHQPDDLTKLDQWLSTHYSCAVGECGLDFYHKELDKNKQHYFFEAQIELAKKHKLPLILHARGAVDAVFQCLKNANYFNAMIHSYNGSIEQTKVLLDKGIKFSFGGAICNPKALKLHKIVNYCPLESVMLETDAPDQNLYPNFKEINIPLNLIKIAKHYANIKNIDFEYSYNYALQVTERFFKILAHE